jgi:phosphomethylpyrimidine synthase
VGIGKGLRTKVNASLGTSSDIVDVEMEVEKARVAEANGADTLMELSTGGDFGEIRRRVVEATTLSVGSVPLYQAFIEAIRKYGAGVDMPEDDLFRATEEQAKLGTNFMAIHTGINSICVERLRRQGGRFGGVCSRGGAFMIGWIIVAAVGASLSSAYGADFICYVTPAEHLALPNVEDVRQGVITARIAAHIGDMIKNHDREQDLAMGRARRDMDWEKQFQLAIDPETARQVRASRSPTDAHVCTMCGDYCALKLIK